MTESKSLILNEDVTKAKAVEPVVTNPEEREHPTEDAVSDGGDIKAKVVKVEKEEDKTVLTLETLDDNKRIVTDTNEIRLHNVEFEVGYVLNLELDEDSKTIKYAQIHSKPSTDEPADDVEDAEVIEDAEIVEVNADAQEDEILLNYLEKDFLLECMSVPTHSKMECRMVTFVMLWAIRNNIKYEFDSFGNIYLTKGELEEGEYYPCVTSHLDTVQSKHDPYIYAGVPLKLKIETTEHNQHKLYVDDEEGTLGSNIGIGADDKGGICICLSLFEYFDKLKACFFLDEETGCNGSDELEKEWFNDVGYVIGYDSPDLYRAAWSCSGVKLFNYKFYEEYMKEVCDSWGLTEGCFFSEPYTDVKNIREKTGIICMNFGNGGYNAHNIGGTEYCIMEDMDHACGMGIDLIEHIGLTRHYLKHTDKVWSSGSSSYIRLADGTFLEKNEEEDDNRKLGMLGDDKQKKSYSYTQTSSSTKKDTYEIKPETLQYIVDQYDTYVACIKEDVIEGVKELCEKNNIEFEQFEKVICSKFNNEIKF